MDHRFSYRKGVFVLAAIFLILNLTAAVNAEPTKGAGNFKIISTIEYSGKGQFRSQAETVYTVERKELNDDMVSYTIVPQGFDVAADESQRNLSGTLSFLVDSKTRKVLTDNKALSLLENVNNQCVRSVTKLDRENLGKTWQQSFNIKSGNYPFCEELTFDMKAIELPTDIEGETIAVRALSKPFSLDVTNDKGETSSIKCKIGTVYLFDSQVETIYLSVSVFEATTKMNGYKELLRHEIGTYMVNSEGTGVDLSGLSKKFAKLIRKVGLRTKALKVSKEVPLPQWASSDIVMSAQAANICAATACEGSLNPVITVCAASGKIIELQSKGKIKVFAEEGIIAEEGAVVVSKELSAAVQGITSMKIAVAPQFMGIGMGAAGGIAGGTVGGIAVAGGGGSSGGDDRTPH